MVVTIGTFGVVLAVFSVLNSIEIINATAASVLVAVVFGVVTIFQQRQSQRRQHTVHLLTEFLAVEHVARGIAWLADRGINNKPVTGQILAEERSYVIAALDYYELISALALRGQIDVRIVLDLLGSSMTRNFDSCRPYIDYRRATNAPKLYSETEFFLAEYCRGGG